MTGNFGSTGCLGNKCCMMMLVFRLTRDECIWDKLFSQWFLLPWWFFFWYCFGSFVMGYFRFFFQSFLFPFLLHVLQVRDTCSGSISFISETAFGICVLCKSLCPAHKIGAEMVELATIKGEFCFVTIWKQPQVQASKHLLQ